MKWQVLHKACWDGKAEEVARLLEAGADANQIAPADWRQSPLRHQENSMQPMIVTRFFRTLNLLLQTQDRSGIRDSEWSHDSRRPRSYSVPASEPPGQAIITVTAGSDGAGGNGFQQGGGQQAQGVVQIGGVLLSGTAVVPDGGFGTFSAVVIGGSGNLQWAYQAQPGAGNNPEVTFNPGNPPTTVYTDAHWYAFVNQPCGDPATYPQGADNSPYNIYAIYNFDGGGQAGNYASYIVTIPDVGGFTDPNQLTLTGLPDISLGADGLWRVTGAGNLQRTTPQAQINVLPTSQFYNKVSTHEGVHVAQFQPGGLFGAYLTVDGYLASAALIAEETEEAIEGDLDSISNAMHDAYKGAYVSQRIAAEQQAYAVSDPIPPQYFYQGQCVLQ